MPGKISILHVDDDPSITDLTATSLEREDDQFSVRTATSAHEGLELVSDRPPDCVVSDYNMPGMDGIEFLRTVRGEFPELPFILYTGRGSEAVASEAIASNVTDYLQKGSGSEQYELLANRIRNAVQARREASRADRQEQLMRLTEFAGETGGFEMDLNRDHILLTEGSREIIGRPDASEISLEEAVELFHPDDREAIQHALSDAVETGEATRGTWRLQPGGGDERFLELTITPVVENGDVTTLRGAGLDVTEQKERERELEAERRVVERTLDALDDLFYVLDPDGTLRRWNERVPEVTGYGEQALTGMRATELFPKPDRKPVAEAVETALAEGDATVETDLLTADGRRIPYEFTGARLTDGDGTLTGLVGVGRELTGDTERKHRALAEEYEALLETSGDAIFLLDVDAAGEDTAFTFARLSSGYETQTGLSTEEVRGKTPQAVFGDERGSELEANYTRCVERRAPVSYREELDVADDARIWETSLAPVSVDDEVVRIVGIARNVTAQVERKRELQRQNERLEEFASVVSHDLRSPLTVAAGSLELAEGSSQSEHLGKARDAIRRSQGLIDDLLTLARDGDHVDETEPVGLVEVAETSWQTVETAQETLEADVQRTIEADRSRLRELLENLYRNAVEHGGGDVTVSVGAMDDGFYVADTGPGIPEAAREEIFEAGYSTNDDGTGLGLLVVEQIADAHGWEIAVTESERGGARFEFTGVGRVE